MLLCSRHCAQICVDSFHPKGEVLWYHATTNQKEEVAILISDTEDLKERKVIRDFLKVVA